MATVPIVLKSPLPPADLLFGSMTYTAGLNRLEEIQLQLLSPKPDLSPDKLLGQKIEITIELRGGARRTLCGHVIRFGIGRNQGRYFGYAATVRPWLWFLTRTTDCRIFQNRTVKEIVEDVLADHAAIAKFEFKLDRTYRKRVYCVQYHETDFNFLARLLEDEGIAWYFEHKPGEHKLVLTDSAGAHSIAPECDQLPYYANVGQVPPQTDYVSDWNFSRSVETGKTALTSYDFERPSTKLLVQKVNVREFDQSEHEQFDFQGDYTQKPDGEQLADNQIDEAQSRFESLAGTTNSQNVACGWQFKLDRHPRADQNRKYLCVHTSITADVHGYESGNPAGEYRCSFGAMPASQQFRPARRTSRPFVHGPQTAVVVGPAGEEIFTDKYGRVKVQFHWDRLGQANEKSSCWLRVSSPWAGKSFGFIQVPRIGQEVVVDFLEGDPDQPIVTGRVYNAEQMPPWDLPANATQSGVLSRSSKGGAYGNANALRFEDKKGDEQVWLHAEKNQDIEVENDETHWVGHDRSKTIDHDETSHIKHDRTETVDNNETITVHGQRTETVDKDETITIHQNRTETVDLNESITIGINRTETVGANESVTIGANRTVAVGASETVTVAMQRTHSVGVNETIAIGAAQEVAVGAAQTITVGANQSTSVGANQTSEIGGDQSNQIAKGRSTQIGKDDALKIGKNLVVDAGDSITIKTGSASITMKKDGTITIKGKDITIEGSGKINAKASGNIVMKGSKILQN